MCPKDCVIFRGELKEDQQCPDCSSFRFTNGKPKKIFKYFPIGPTIGRLYQDENLIKIWHAHSCRPEGGFIKDIWDTNGWKNDWFGSSTIKKGHSNGCVLIFCSDGVNPYKIMHVVYSIRPIMLSLLNFPIPLRKSVGGILLVGIVAGNGRKETNNPTPYLDILVDELLVLSECHVFHPAYMKAPVNIKVKLLQYVSDFPAIVKILQQPVADAIKACPFCKIQGCCCFSLKKTVYRDSRKYLEQEDKLRISSTCSSSEDREKPATLSVLEEKYRGSKFDKIKVGDKLKLFVTENDIKGAYSSMKLPYHQFHGDYQPDGMHTATDVVKTVMN